MTQGAPSPRSVDAGDPTFANETSGFNLIPFASMAGGWLGPLLMFWLYVWGPLRPFHYPEGELLPPLPLLAACFALGVAVWWIPASYYDVRAFERSGRLYEKLGVRHFRWFVPDGDAANRWRRRRDPAFRIIRSRRYAKAFRHRTELSEKSHLVMLVLGGMSAGFAWGDRVARVGDLSDGRQRGRESLSRLAPALYARAHQCSARPSGEDGELIVDG